MSDKFTFSSAGLVHELELAMDRVGGYNAALVKRMCEGDRLAHIREYLLDQAEIVVKATKSALTSLSELIKARAFNWVNSNITDERFPTPDRLWNDYKEFHFGKDISSEEAIKRMQAEGYEPANSHELLLWDGWNGENAVIALGSVAGVAGYRGVLMLRRSDSGRLLNLRWWGGDWLADCRFLAVRPSASLGTGKSSGS